MSGARCGQNYVYLQKKRTLKMQSSPTMIDEISNLSSVSATDVEGTSYNNKKKGVSVNLFHKLTKLVAYTSTVASEAYQNLTGYNDNTEIDVEPNYDYDEVMQINADDDFVGSEPPPPYDNMWSPMTSSSPDNAATSQPAMITSKPTSTTSRRKQIRVHRGRRLLMDLIVEGKAALTSTVAVTDVEFFLSEEKEREERIMRELGIKTPVTRRSRSSTCSSASSDSDSILSTTSVNSYYGYCPSFSDRSGEYPTAAISADSFIQYGPPAYFRPSPNCGYFGPKTTPEQQCSGDSNRSSDCKVAPSYGYGSYVNMHCRY
ncbi:2595_t:CDS:2 [Acaulospora morrowiae]|uniref:2595_t:CDS:1 n=1 Tax=Acaulospora morrowiae TaxID=94023 RepID=A0A9N8YPT0_9GLOM|nr:2595_t:CDS:2 [Acaulospora morrowiae]